MNVVWVKLTIVLNIYSGWISYAVTACASGVDYVVGKVHGATNLAHAVAVKLIYQAKRV